MGRIRRATTTCSLIQSGGAAEWSQAAKFWLDGGIRVPFIAWWPGRIAPGRVSDPVGYFGDWMATAAELSGGYDIGRM